MAKLDHDPGGSAVTVEQRPNEAVLSVRGEFDLANVETLQQAIEPLLAADDVQLLVFDMTELGFMDSSVIAVLLQTAATGRTVRLRNPSALIRQVIAATGLAEVLHIEP